jgi:hypothetical protein
MVLAHLYLHLLLPFNLHHPGEGLPSKAEPGTRSKQNTPQQAC